MRPRSIALTLVAVGLPLASRAASASAGPRLQVLNAAVRVVATSEPRADVAAALRPGSSRIRPAQITAAQGSVTVDGGYPAGSLSCAIRRGQAYVRTPAGPVALSDLPVLVVHLPLAADVLATGAVYGEIGPSGALKLYDAGCGDWRAGDVRGALELKLAAGGDVAAGSAGSATVSSVGSGDATLGTVHGALTVKSAGSGGVTVAEADGPLDIRTAGSGDVRVAAGRAPTLQVASSGSGDVRFGGTAGAVTVALSGSGGVRVAHATGAVRKQVSGSGGLTVGR